MFYLLSFDNDSLFLNFFLDRFIQLFMFGYKNLCCNFWRKRNSTINTKKKNIFEETQGLTEERMNRYYKKWMCSECKYTSDTFMEFIPKKFSNDYNVVTVKNMNQEPETIPGRELLNNYNIPSSEIFSQNLNLKNNRNSESNKTIAINFTSDNQIVQYCVPCNLNEQFKAVLNKLYEEYSEYKTKKCLFLVNGCMIDENKTIAENNLKNGNHIMIHEIDS